MTLRSILLAAAAGAGLVLILLYGHERASASRLEQERQAFLARITADSAELVRLVRVADSATRASRASQAVADSARASSELYRRAATRLGDSLNMLLARLPTVVPAACQPFADALAVCRARGDQLAAALAKMSSADSADTAALHADTIALRAKDRLIDSLRGQRDQARQILARPLAAIPFIRPSLEATFGSAGLLPAAQLEVGRTFSVLGRLELPLQKPIVYRIGGSWNFW